MNCNVICAENIFGDGNNSKEDSEVYDGYIVDYYGVISNDLDANMSTMISDLYHTQLSEIPNFTVFDKRISPINTPPSASDISNSENTIFYTEIIKNKSDETWTLSYIVKIKKQMFSKGKKYDSFYKILMESKNELEVSVKELIAQGESDSAQATGYSSNFLADDNYSDIFADEGESEKSGDIAGNNGNNNKSLGYGGNENVVAGAVSEGDDGYQENKKKVVIKSLEMLSGTWKGDSSIDKIVILRGGRGFIIFKNGASMNITVSIEENNGEQTISVKQKGNSNASFYPDLPRKIALEAAVSAPPMEWSMILMEDMIMEGTKTTLVQDNDSFKVSEVPVSWQKVN